MDQEVKDIIIEWIYEIYKLKNFNNVAERNIWEAEVKEKWDRLDSLIGKLDPKTREDYEEEIDCLEGELDNLREDMRMLIERRDELFELNDQYEEDIKCLEERNFDLQEENEKLKTILTNVSEAVNVTWS